MKISISVSRNQITGNLELSSLVNNQLISRKYFGYTLKEAKALFKQWVKDNCSD